MIRLVYCDVLGVDHGAKLVTGAGPHADLPSFHFHGSGSTEEVCKLVINVTEDHPGGAYPWLCGDGSTVVNNDNEWFVYLAGFLP